MKPRLLLVFLIFHPFFSWCQDLDSLLSSSYEAYSNFKLEKSISLAEEALVLSKNSGNKIGEIQALFYREISSQQLNPSSLDPKRIESMIPEMESNKLNLLEARAYNFLASLYGRFGDVEKAIENHLKARDIFQDMNNRGGISMIHTNLSMLYYDQYDFTNAFYHARKSLEMDLLSEDSRQIQISYNNLATIFEQTGPIDSAIYYHSLALEKAVELNNPYAIGLSLNNLGNNHSHKGDLGLAEELLIKSLNIRDSLGYTLGLAYTHNCLSTLYQKAHKLNKANYHAKKSLENAEKSAEVKILRMAYERLAEVAELRGDYRAGLGYMKKGAFLMDSITNESKARELTQQILNYEFKKKKLIDSLKNLQEKNDREIFFNDLLGIERNRKTLYLISGIFFLIIAIGLYHRSRFIKKSSQIIEKEKERSDELLLNILPPNVAEELKKKGYSEARNFEEVTVIFTDFADFTKKAQHLSATELVFELNICFKAFDQIIGEFRLEKIKTIGDAYLAAGGLHNESGVIEVISAAIKIKDFITKRNFDPRIPSKVKFDMRIGINNGPLVAGIVGSKKFQYDIWGDTVNTAQRMEASCGLNKINISENTYNLIKNYPDFRFESRGPIPVKGKGLLNMWYVESSKYQLQKFQDTTKTRVLT
ncbi:MAG: adenylate/guanylate cyclase domain-containing protein [Algoriphagus sp.]|uniref:adenylate/guanylate cyclase domain-containing protein n=1 Tax=Algoriphagus sp. TaxID=1872435 RepID=UPI0026310C48|nr:adenylate/guanylate cyclase domain-containing protein [Algoriphagus sp.]MDG1276156.1 adenylate/guanylate cyclase domain-containing protein [Algoriphagus sp.]